jgi:ribosome-associated protein
MNWSRRARILHSVGKALVRALSSVERPFAVGRRIRSPEPDFMPSTTISSTTPNTSNSLALAQRAAHIALDYKAQDVVVLDLRGVTEMTDFFVIASGTSDTHVRSLGQHVMEDMKKEGSRAHHVEGLEKGRWVLLDFVDFVVHIFHPTLRNFYQLERLWADAEQVPLAGGQGTGA